MKSEKCLTCVNTQVNMAKLTDLEKRVVVIEKRFAKIYTDFTQSKCETLK